jgi:hypothetical protein
MFVNDKNPENRGAFLTLRVLALLAGVLLGADGEHALFF